MPDTPILTKNEYKTLYDIPLTPNATLDAKLDQLIPWVQVAVRNLSGRAFGEEASGPSERSYAYDGSGFCDIDDASAITQVKVGTLVVPTTQWVPKPEPWALDDAHAYWWLENLPYYNDRSPEMGFLQNWDVFGVPPNERVFVTATWGWPTIPGDVKMAAAWTLNAWIEVPGAFINESIESFSRTVSLPSGLQDAIPARAQTLLESYDRGPAL